MTMAARRSLLERAPLRQLLAATVSVLLLLCVASVPKGYMDQLLVRARAMQIRIVFEPGVGTAKLDQAAATIRQHWPDAQADLIGPDEAMALLALQESWMGEVQGVVVGGLPPMIELWHPDILDSPAAVDTLVGELAALEGVDFVAFNDAGHAEFVDLLKDTRSAGRFLFLLALAAVTVLLYMAGRNTMERDRGGWPIAAILRAAVGFSTGVALFLGLRAVAAGAGALPLPHALLILITVAAVLVLIEQRRPIAPAR